MRSLLFKIQKESIYHNTVASVIRTTVRLNLHHAKSGKEYVDETKAVIQAIIERIETKKEYEFLVPYLPKVAELFNERRELVTEMLYINKELGGVSYVMLNRTAPLKRGTIPMTKAEFAKQELDQMSAIMNLLYEISYACFRLEQEKEGCTTKYPNFSALALSFMEIFEPLHVEHEKHVNVLNGNDEEVLMESKSYMEESQSREEIGMFLTLMCSCILKWVKDEMDGNISDEQIEIIFDDLKLGKFKDLLPTVKEYIKKNLC